LLISHRFPYPPDRGEKIRLWHILRHLARAHRIFLGCLVDDKRDWQYRKQVQAFCAELGCFGIDKRRQKLRALARFRPGRALMLDYYDSSELHHWTTDIAARVAIDLVYIYSTAMAPYALGVAAPRRILDMQDVDSEKWADYGRKSGWPARFVWAREARTLLAYERRAAMACERTLLVTEAECRRFAQLAPESSDRVFALGNGVDLDFFDGAAGGFPDPYPSGPLEAGPWLALVGNMDYWPNADAATWFALEVLPMLRHLSPPPRLAIVGANPAAQVQRLADQPGVLVTGRVADVRPYLAHAAVVVAPLRIARGIQNKVLEGMAMSRPVVASPQAYEGIHAEPGRDLLVADGAEAMAHRVAEVLDGRHPGLGSAGRQAVERAYSWPAQLARLDAILAATFDGLPGALAEEVAQRQGGDPVEIARDRP
jgi:sugar transferase (PEP-CTERM/EpsH1 system associated)